MSTGNVHACTGFSLVDIIEEREYGRAVELDWIELDWVDHIAAFGSRRDF